MMTLGLWTNKTSKFGAQCVRDDMRFKGFTIIHTIELGNILTVHTESNGEFNLGTNKVQNLFAEFRCQFVLTCYPAKHYKDDPELAKQLSILFPEIDRKITVNLVSYYPEIRITADLIR